MGVEETSRLMYEGRRSFGLTLECAFEMLVMLGFPFLVIFSAMLGLGFFGCERGPLTLNNGGQDKEPEKVSAWFIFAIG